MKSFLLLLLTIPKHHTIQYEKTEEVKLINIEKLPEKHEEQSNNFSKGDIRNLTNMKDSVKIDLEPYSEHYQHNYRELRDGEKVGARRWLDMHKIINLVNQLFGKTVKGPPRPPSPPRPRGMRQPKGGSRETRKPKHKKTRQDWIIDIDDNIPESFEMTFNKKDSDEEQILQNYKRENRKIDVPMIFIVPAGE